MQIFHMFVVLLPFEYWWLFLVCGLIENLSILVDLVMIVEVVHFFSVACYVFDDNPQC